MEKEEWGLLGGFSLFVFHAGYLSVDPVHLRECITKPHLYPYLEGLGSLCKETISELQRLLSGMHLSHWSDCYGSVSSVGNECQESIQTQIWYSTVIPTLLLS